MAYPIARIDPTTAGDGRSPALWRNALDRYAADTLLGNLRESRFEKAISGVVDEGHGGWWFSECAAAGVTGELLGTNIHPDGEFTLQATSGTDHFGVKMQGGSSATVGEGIVTPQHATAATRRGDVIFEHRFLVEAANQDTLVTGLFEQAAVSGVLGATSLLLDTVDYIGFYKINDGDLQFVVRNDNAGGTAVEYNVDVMTAAAFLALDGEYLKLGLRINRNSTVEIFINGVAVKYSSETTPVKIVVPTTSLPEVDLSRTIGVVRGATGDASPVRVKSSFCDCYVEA